jgi:hypothetical protein
MKRSSVAVEGSLQVAKWLHLQLLCDEQEMTSLLQELQGARLFRCGEVVTLSDAELSHRDFLARYAEYVGELRDGRVPELGRFRSVFSTFWTVSDELLYLMEVREERYLVKATRPGLQLQLHQLGYSPVDGKFRPMVLGSESICWGIQFSYPQIFQDPKSGEEAKVDESDRFPNTALFRKLQLWVRYNSIATPFEVEGQKINVPMRLGRNCFSWINRHPQLASKGIRVIELNHAH